MKKKVIATALFAACMMVIPSIQGTVRAAGAPPAEAVQGEEKKPVQILFTNVNSFDGFSYTLQNNMSVLIEANFIKEVDTKIRCIQI